MRKIILYSAISLDDYIADQHGSIEWLHRPEFIPEGEDFGYGAFYESIDTTLMGNKTYKQVLGFDVPFPYPDKKNYVFTTSMESKSDEYVEFISRDIGGFCKRLKEEPGMDIWLVGGGKLNSALLDEGLIDLLILTKIPVPLGKGIPLFHQSEWKKQFPVSETKVFPAGVVQFTMGKES